MKTLGFVLFCSVFLIILAKKIENDPKSNAIIVCPDGLSICPATYTCCISIDGDYSCCPMEKGVCCSDHIHCCPEHYKCNLKIFKCDRTIKAKINPVKLSSKLN